MFIGLVLIAVGIIWLLVKLGVLTGSIWAYTWPVILIILGLVLIFGHRRRHAFWRRWWSSEDEERK